MTDLGRRVWLVAVLLLAVVGVRAWVSVPAAERPRKEFAGFPSQLGGWTQAGAYKMDEEVGGVLRADDLVDRRYIDSAGHNADLFIAYYKVDRKSVV